MEPILGAICSSRPDAPFAPICSTTSKNKLVDISQNYLVIFSVKIESTRLRMHVLSSKTYFDACFKAHIVAFYQTRHLHLFSGSVRKN
jgi:hypothetical protein